MGLPQIFHPLLQIVEQVARIWKPAYFGLGIGMIAIFIQVLAAGISVKMTGQLVEQRIVFSDSKHCAAIWVESDCCFYCIPCLKGLGIINIVRNNKDLYFFKK